MQRVTFHPFDGSAVVDLEGKNKVASPVLTVIAKPRWDELRDYSFFR